MSPQTPIAIVDGEPGRIVEFSVGTERDGIERGMTSSQALARSPALQIFSRAIDQEKAMSEMLREIACSLSLYVEQTAPEICTLDLRCAQVTDMEKWAANAIKVAADFDLQAQVGIAVNPGLALLAAQSSDSVCIVRDSAKFLFQKPLTALSPNPTAAKILRDWGIHNLGDLARLPLDGLTARLGEEGHRLWNAAHGRGERLLKLVRTPEIFCETFDFEREIETLEPLLFIIRRFLDSLTRRLELTYRVAAKMTLTLPLSNGGKHEREFSIPAPTNEIEVLFRILDTHLEQLKLEHGPIAANLVVEPSKPHRQQFGLFENSIRDPNRFSETLARLTALLGAENVGFPALQPTHRPDACELRAPDFSNFDAEVQHSNGVKVGLPLRRFRPPFRAQVSLKNHAPHFVVSEKAHGAIKDALGPHRLSGDWWDEKAWAIEQWIVETEEGIYLLSRQQDQWLVEGCYEEFVALR